MKKNILLILGIVISMGIAQAQSSMMYFMKGKTVINQQSVTAADVDSIIFYNPIDSPNATVTFKLNFYNDVPEVDRAIYSEGPADIRVKDMEGTKTISVLKGSMLGDIDEVYSLPTVAYHFSGYLREDAPYEFGGWTTDPLTVEDPIDLNNFKVTSDITLYAIWNTPTDGFAWTIPYAGGLNFDPATGMIVFNATVYYKKVAHLVIPPSVGGVKVTGIGDYAFTSDRIYLSVIVPEGVTTLGASAFDAAYSLRKVTLPSTITSLGNNCFGGQWMPAGSFNLKTFIIKAKVPPTFGVNAIAKNYLDIANIQIIVPSASVDAYKAAPGWSDFAINIVGGNF